MNYGGLEFKWSVVLTPMVEFTYQLMDFHSPKEQSALHTVHPTGLFQLERKAEALIIPLL